MYYDIHLPTFGSIQWHHPRKAKSDAKRGNCQWWIPFLEIFTVQGKITRSLPKDNLGDTPIFHRSMIAGGSKYHLPVVFRLVHQFQLFSMTRMGRSMNCFYTHPWDAFSADKTNCGSLNSSEGNNTMDQVSSSEPNVMIVLLCPKSSVCSLVQIPSIITERHLPT